MLKSSFVIAYEADHDAVGNDDCLQDICELFVDLF